MPLAHIQPLLHNPVNIQLLFIISSTASGKLHLSMQQWSQRWELMGCRAKNSVHAGSGQWDADQDRWDLHFFEKWSLVSHWCKNVTCLLKRKNSEGEREEGLLHNHLRQWLIIIIMRQISRPTGGLYEPPTLHIYFSFSLLLLPTSCVWPFRSSFRAITQICNIFSLYRLLCISFPFPVFPPVPSLPFLFFAKWIFFVCFLISRLWHV